MTTSEAEEPRNRPSRRTVTLIVTPIIILVICGWIGDASAAYLVDHHPVWLIALNARNRNLLLVTNYVDAAPYYIVGTLRLLLSDPLFYLLGYLYGDAAVRWMERKAPTYGKLMRSAEQFFTIAAYPLVFFAPNNFICLFAGAAGMSIPVFLVLNISGTIVRLVHDPGRRRHLRRADRAGDPGSSTTTGCRCSSCRSCWSSSRSGTNDGRAAPRSKR